MFSKEELREIAFNSLKEELHNLACNYMKICDEYYKTFSRDSAFLKDAMDSIKGLAAVFEVYTRDNSINSTYALEKLKFSRNMIDSAIEYFEGRGDSND